MAYKIVFTALLICTTLKIASSLRCMTCDSLSEEGDKNLCLNAKAESETCNSYQDVCFKFTTITEEPNNGPQDRRRDNDEFTIISRGCGTKEPSYERVVQTTVYKGKCVKETVGGGGYMERCSCAGNTCNSSESMKAGLALLATALLVKMFI